MLKLNLAPLFAARGIDRPYYFLKHEPNDLFEWQPAPERIITDNHPLFNLKTNKEARNQFKKDDCHGAL